MSLPRHGVHPLLEAEADRLIKESLAGVTSQSEKSDILTPWKEKDRRQREVYVPSGVPEETRRGMYSRSWNSTSPHLNSVDGMSGRRPSRIGLSSLQSHVDAHGSGSWHPEAED